MKIKLLSIIIGLPFYLLAQTTPDFPVLTGEYLGQTPPDTIPEIFAPGIVSVSSWAEHCQLAISPNGDEIYWSAFSNKYPRANGSSTEQIYFSRLENGRWTKPDLAEFLNDNLTNSNGGPVFSPNGDRIYFYSDRPGGLGGTDVWYVERENEKWSIPVNAGAPLNSENYNWSPSFSKKGYAYQMGFYHNNPDEKPIRYLYKNNQFLDSSIVKIHPDYYPFYSICVSPDEDYLIFSGYHYLSTSQLDLYICFKNNDGNWGYPVKLKDQINTETTERFPVISPDGKYLFFIRHRDTNNFFWVSTKILNKYRNESIEKMKDPIIFKAIELELEELEKYVGVYYSPECEYKITISIEEIGLLASIPGRNPFRLECFDENSFKYDQQLLKFVFYPLENKIFLQGGGGNYTCNFAKENL